MKPRTKKIAAYTVSGVTFLGAVTGLLVNMTRLGDSLSEKDQGEIQIMPTLIQESPEVGEMDMSDEQHSVSYQVDQSQDAITINFDSSAINEPVTPVGILGEGPFFALPKVGIDIKMVNNTQDAIFVTDAVIEVRSSSTNTDPLFISVQNDGIVGYLTWVNEGWGEPDNVSLTAKIAGQDMSPMTLPFSVQPYDLTSGQSYQFDILPLLQTVGIDPGQYRKARDAYYGDDYSTGLWTDIQSVCLRKFADLNSVAEFVSMISGETVTGAELTDEQLGTAPWSCGIELEGELTLDWTKSGAAATQTYPFNLYVLVTPPDGLGAVGFQPTGAYDFELKTEGENYTINVPISQPVSPTGFDRFVLWLGAEKSSQHEFIIKLKYNQDGEILSQPIRLDYLRPRSSVTASGN